MVVHRIVQGEPGIFPPGPGALLRWLRGRRAQPDRGPAAPADGNGPSRDQPDDEPQGEPSAAS